MWWSSTLIVIALVALVAFNALCVVLVFLQLPGTWLMLLATALAAWWGQWEQIGGWTLCTLAVVALAGELVELLAGMAGAARAGGTRRAAGLALLGAVVRAIVGTLALPVPLIGSLLGACLGAAAGSVAGDRWAGRNWQQAAAAGTGAAKGRFFGTLGKVACAAIMWLIVTIAVMV